MRWTDKSKHYKFPVKSVPSNLPLTSLNFLSRMSDLPNYEQDSKIQFVIDAVFAFAHALDALKADICPTWKGVCPAMIRYDGGEFYKKYLLKVDFEG